MLTIGDGIVTQVPALVISIGTGIIVTRSAEDARLATESLRQLLAHPRILSMIILALMAISFVPGVPAAPVIIVATIILAAWRLAILRRQRHEMSSANDADVDAETLFQQELVISPIEIWFSSDLAASAVAPRLLDDIAILRKQLALRLGLVLPTARIKTAPPPLSEGQYEIRLQGIKYGAGQLRLGKLLAIKTQANAMPLDAVETREPVFNTTAYWINPEQSVGAQQASYSVADPGTVILTHVKDILERNLAELLTRAETERMIYRVRQEQPNLVEELIPTLLAVADVQHILQALLRENVSIRNLSSIFEVLVDQARYSKDSHVLTESVRSRLGALIYEANVSANGELTVLTLAPMVEMNIAESLRRADANTPLAIEPRLAEQLLLKLSEKVEAMLRQGCRPVLVVQPEIRRGLRLFCEKVIPQLAIMSLAEIPAQGRVKVFDTVDGNPARAVK